MFRTTNNLAVKNVDEALEFARPRVINIDLWYASQEVMNHLDSPNLVFITESKSNRLIEDGGKKQVRDYLAEHQDAFEEMNEPSTEYRFVHEVVSKIKGGLVVKFVFLKKDRDENAIVLMTNALDMPADEVIRSYKRRWDIEVYYRDCFETREWVSTRSGRST